MGSVKSFLSTIVMTSLMVCIHSRCYSQYIPPKVPDKVCKALDGAVLAADAGQTAPAIKQIVEMIEKYPSWTEPRHRLSKIYYTQGKKKEAITVLEQSIAIDTASQLQQLYTLARLYEENSQYDLALTSYQKLISHPAITENLLEKARTSSNKLERKLTAFKSDYTISLKALDPSVNSADHEALGRWTADGGALIFTRLINEQEDLYKAQLSPDGQIESVEEIPINTPYNEGGHTISPDGKYLIFTSCDRPGGMGSCDLYLTVLEDGEWGEPVNMGPGFNSSSWDSQPVFGLDGLSLYFASTRPGGSGGSDIWMTQELSVGKWSAPKNLGPVINTVNNESSPFLHFDGRTLYFMRDGEEGLGGYDLYMAKQGINGAWQAPQNMGMPINSGADEGALAVHPDGRLAMIARRTEDRKHDLFVFDLPEAFHSDPVQLLQANIKDRDTGKPVAARLEIFEIKRSDTIRVSQWADPIGDISITIDRNKSYGIIATAPGYIMYSSHLPADSSAIRKENILMMAIDKAADKPIALQNIFFETGSARLLPSSNPELSKLLWTLRNNEQMHIEIRGHTDDVGMDDYNQVLSEERAKAVYQYLIDRGIPAGRLSYKGFGETQPVASNETEAGRRQNRRTEFVILKK